MTNDAVVNGWVEAMSKNYGYAPKALHANSIHADGIYLVSYATPIAKYINGKFQLTSRKYSTTTAKHQSLVRHYVPADKLEIVDNIDVPNEAYPWKWSGK